MRAVCGVFRVGERCFSLGSILAAAACKRPYGKYCGFLTGDY